MAQYERLEDLAELGLEPIRAIVQRIRAYPAVASLIFANVIVFFALPIVFASRFPYRRECLGALWGPLFFDGQWWRLITSNFIHFEIFHLLGNMIGLWILGKRIEREFGNWTFVLLYLFSGIISGLPILVLHPLTVAIGASGAIAGLIGAAIAIYSPRVKSLSWGKRAKLAALILAAASIVATDFSASERNLGHAVGLFAGGLLGSFFVHVANSKRARYWTFGILAMLVVVACAFLQYQHELRVRSFRKGVLTGAVAQPFETPVGALPFSRGLREGRAVVSISFL